MAPIVAKSILPSVRDMLHDAHTGYGIDFLLPFVLLYPHDKIAVIDRVCMIHPFVEDGSPSRQRLYDLALPLSGQVVVPCFLQLPQSCSQKPICASEPRGVSVYHGSTGLPCTPSSFKAPAVNTMQASDFGIFFIRIG